ncbi:DUF6255 family natural product biosynthesis protein [Streptomyces gamaensis]|uniref:DUF6255 family natural product biosynthesis protein n=1 Tax=Streptomyces gamaensis TaxID=1763542 RepID=A0ABW0YWM8_9ACTN
MQSVCQHRGGWEMVDGVHVCDGCGIRRFLVYSTLRLKSDLPELTPRGPTTKATGVLRVVEARDRRGDEREGDSSEGVERCL